MSGKTQSQAPFLIGDDDAAWLEDRYEVRTPYDGEMALEHTVDAVDILLLERRVQGRSGDQVLTELRDSDYDCPVAMVTAVDPYIGLALLGFKNDVSKPVDKTVLYRATYSTQIERYTAPLTRKVPLDQELSEVKFRAIMSPTTSKPAKSEPAKQSTKRSVACWNRERNTTFREMTNQQHI